MSRRSTEQGGNRRIEPNPPPRGRPNNSRMPAAGKKYGRDHENDYDDSAEVWTEPEKDTKVSDEDWGALISVFRTNAEDDGQANSDQLYYIFNELAGDTYSREECEKIVDEADEEGTGTVGFEVVLKVFKKWKHEMNIGLAFEVIDRDNDGFISKDEIKDVMEQVGAPLTDAELNSMMKTADRDHDDMLTFEEFKGALIDFE